MIKGIRRSLKGEKTMSSGSGNSVNTLGEKNPLHTIPPKMAIEALYDYKPQGPGELPFTKGDFFHVISNEQDSEWFEAYNPARNVRGMVPVPYFKIHANKTTTNNVSPSDSHHSLLPEERKALHRSSQSKHAQHSPQQVLANGLDVSQSMQNLSLGSGEHTRHASMAGASDRSSQGKNQPSLHGVVLYDFVAERTDELAASKGEHISVIAQSNHEWFVAKHIVRLGGPGLIPVSFVEIRNLDTDEVVTDVEAAVRAAGVPTVEEWKRHAADYKASSITLGDIEGPDHDAHQRDQQLRQQALEQQRAHEQQALGEEQKRQHEQALLQWYVERAPGPLVVSARVDSYHYTHEKFWYLVDCTLEDGTVRRLCRFYQDFYMFQLTLLGAFEEAAGRRDQERLLPYMPGPLKYVTDTVSSQRRENLHDYVGQLLALPPYIAQSNVLQNLFAIKQGDVEADGPTDQLPQPLAPDEEMFDNAKAEAEAKGIRPITRTDSHMSSSDGTLLDNNNGESRPTSGASRLMGPPAAYATAPGGGHQRMASVSTVGPTADNPAVNTPQSSSNSVKVKVFYHEDLIAIRVPSDIDFLTLHDRLCERLRVASLSLEYKVDDGRRLPLVNDVDLDEALHAKNKLVLYAA